MAYIKQPKDVDLVVGPDIWIYLLSISLLLTATART